MKTIYMLSHQFHCVTRDIHFEYNYLFLTQLNSVVLFYILSDKLFMCIKHIKNCNFSFPDEKNYSIVITFCSLIEDSVFS